VWKMETGGNEKVTILMVEDNPGHARLIEKNLRRSSVDNPIIVLEDGKHAVDYLFDDEAAVDRQNYPQVLILLDLNLPVIDGFAVLERIKSDRRTWHIPVIVLTTSNNQEDVNRCYQLGCNAFITKPVEYKQFADVVAKLGMFLTIVAVPDTGGFVGGDN